MKGVKPRAQAPSLLEIKRLLAQSKQRGGAGRCPDEAEFMRWIERPSLGREHRGKCAACREAFVVARRIRREWSRPAARRRDATTIVPLPMRLRAAVARLRMTSRAAVGVERIRLTVLYAVDWVGARLTRPAGLAFAPAMRGAARKPVPVVAGEISAVALDSSGRRMPRLAASLVGPHARGRHAPVRRIRANGRGLFILRNLAAGRYLLKTGKTATEVHVGPAPKELLP